MRATANYGMDWRSPCVQQAPRRGNEHPAQGKRAKRCDTLGFERWGPIRPNGAKAGTGARLSPHDALYATNTRFRTLPLSPPVAAFAPLGRIGSPSASPRVSLAALACPGLGAYYPFGVLVERTKRALHRNLATCVRPLAPVSPSTPPVRRCRWPRCNSRRGGRR